MQSIKIHKIAAIGLLMILAVEIGQAQKELPPLENHIEGEMRIVGNYPKVGEIFEIVYRIKVKETADWTRKKDNLTHDYLAVIRYAPPEAVEILGEDKFFFSGLTIGETREFRTRCRILKPVGWIYIDGDIDLAVQGKSYGPVAISGDKSLWLLDPQTGQYGTRTEYEKGLPVEYRYDFSDGRFLGPQEACVGWVEENRKIIEMMKRLESALSDSEALLLHSEQFQVGAPRGTVKWDEEEEKWIEDEMYEYYLKDGWFKAAREGRLEEWRKKEKEKIQKEWKGGGGTKFFRPDSNHHNNLLGGSRYWKTFDGF